MRNGRTKITPKEPKATEISSPQPIAVKALAVPIYPVIQLVPQAHFHGASYIVNEYFMALGWFFPKQEKEDALPCLAFQPALLPNMKISRLFFRVELEGSFEAELFFGWCLGSKDIKYHSAKTKQSSLTVWRGEIPIGQSQKNALECKLVDPTSSLSTVFQAALVEGELILKSAALEVF